ncbi:MAG TPA: septum formation initiator family protein [Egibacteraceae bacterium]
MLVTVVVLGILVAMSIGPLQTLLAATERVQLLTASRDQLQAEVDRLEERKDELSDPEELEIIARSELGLVKPGEQPYVVVRPEDDLEQVRPEEQAAPPAEPWYRRLGRALGLVD